MQFIRGTTPTIVITVKSDIDLTEVAEVWIYISQQNKVKVDKELSDVIFDYENKTMTVTLSQEDTLALKADKANISQILPPTLFQIRVLMNDGTALATVASEVEVIEVYKGGVITYGE